MEDINEIVGRLCNMIEDAIEEQNWDLVQVVAKEMDEFYEDLERQTSNLYDCE